MSPLTRKRSAKHFAKQTIALLDIGSGSLGAALIEVEWGTSPTILAFKRFSLRLNHHRTARELQTHVFRAAREAVAHLHVQTRGRRVSRLAVFLPAPWSTLDLHTVRFSQPRAFLADTKLLTRLVADHSRQEDALYTEAARVPTGGVAQDPVFERTTVGMKLNGYVVPALPERTPVLTIELMLAAARAPGVFLNDVRAIAQARFSEVTFHSTALAAAHALARVIAETGIEKTKLSPFLLCDGEGEIAELMVVKDMIPEAHGTIPVGYGTIVRTLALHGDFSNEETASALALARDPQSLIAVHAREAITLAQQECADALGSVAHLCEACIPTRAYIIGDGREAQWFGEALKNSPRLKAVLPDDFVVQVVTAKSINEYLSYPHHTKGDVMLGLEALFARDRFGNPEAQSFYAI